jgi:flagellar basal-body rod modification protein FlgD
LFGSVEASLAQRLLFIKSDYRKESNMSTTTNSTTSVSSLQMDYMKLLVTQLQNQNPLEPMNNDQMASQLAQYSELQQLESMNSSFSSVLDATQKSYASSLIGKTVSYYVSQGDGSVESVEGVVKEVGTDKNGDVILNVNDIALSLDDIVTVK